MSLPRRPAMSSAERHERPPRYQDSPSRKSRPLDVEASTFSDESQTSRPGRRPRQQAFIEPALSPGAPFGRNVSAAPVQELGRKKSLVRPERGRIDPDHPNYYYRRHAQNMTVHPSTTGNEPIVEDAAENDNSSEESEMKVYPRRDPGHLGNIESLKPQGRKLKRDGDLEAPKRLRRKSTKGTMKPATVEGKRWHGQQESLRPPSLWNVYCAIITFWAPNAILACLGKPARAQQRAWREKIGLISIIIIICAFVGFLTFGFTEAVCGRPTQRFRVNEIDRGYMVFHGQAYNMAGDSARHPAAEGIPVNSHMVYDFPNLYGGQDGSFFFQNVNGACRGIIRGTENTSIPTNGRGDLAWYFPCKSFDLDGSSRPNKTFEYYNGYACHTTVNARETFYSPVFTRPTGDVVFSWNDIRNTSRNLTVYSGAVLDLNLLDWFNDTQIIVPQELITLRENTEVRGVDLTHALQSASQRQLGQCLTEIIKVGSIDTETVGCIASQVVLYVSLVFILAIVLSKFLLALLFQWIFCRRFAAPKSAINNGTRERAQEIEEWTNDIYRPPPRLLEAVSPANSKRASIFLPTTSRFTNPYDTDRSSKSRPPPTTMASQNSTARLLPTSNLSKSGDGSESVLEPPAHRFSTTGSRSSLLLSSIGTDRRQSMAYGDMSEGTPRGFIHDAVIPQPPAEWEPFGYPLAHALCLVTAYSEGEEGIRTTLNSIATTEYPNSHKTILVICDGMVKGHGEELTTPEIVLGMMHDHVTMPDEVKAFSYVAVASGSKRHNMAKIFAGFYDYGERSVVPKQQQQRVPMLVVVKCGTPDEVHKNKPGNRGKRDSQIILMSFLQKVMFDERMTELEFEMFNGLWRVTGISPDFYEIMLMVDADTKIFPDSITHMASAMVKDPEIMGLCGETKIANKRSSWVSMIQVFEYFISHHLSKSFESVFGGVTCLPGCFSMYRIKAPKGGQNYWVPILANPDVVEHYSENVVDTLHKKNLLLLGEDRYLSTLMLKTFPKRKQVFVPQAVCKTTVPEQFSVLLSQRRRWINSTVHNLMELVLVRDLCGTFCFSMQFVVFIELVGTLVLPAAISFTFYLIVISFVRRPVPVIPLVLLALILGLPAVLIVMTAHRWSYVLWMFIYLLSLPVWNFVLPLYAYWKFDDFSWGDTRKTAGEKVKKAGIEYEGEFDSSKITMKRWGDFEKERRVRNAQMHSRQPSTITGSWPAQYRQTANDASV